MNWLTLFISRRNYRTRQKKYIHSEPIKISPDQTREQIIDYLQKLRDKNTTADLAFYAYRDMKTCDWLPFIKAAIERSPVSIEMTEKMSLQEVYEWLEQMDNNSIYDGDRLAHPDEVANYKRGDGLEKAFVLANIIHKKASQTDIEISVTNGQVSLKAENEYKFVSDKNLEKQIKILSTGKIFIIMGM